MKQIKFNTPQGQFTLPLESVAKDRANYYADKENFGESSEEYKEEVDFVMNDDFEGIDWLINNTDFEDWTDQIRKLNNQVNVTDEDFWCSSDDFEIIELN